MIVSDSTPLIYLAKIGRLQLLKEFFKEVIISEEAWKEVVKKGKEEKCPDAFVVERAMKEGWIKTHQVKIIKGLDEFGIDEGEAEGISLAVNLKLKEVLVDQTHARLAAKTLGLKPIGTIFVLLKALKKGILNYDGYLTNLEDLVKAGFRMSDDVYLKAVKLGRNIVEGR